MHSFELSKELSQVGQNSLLSFEIQMNMLVSELKSEALKERHWKEMMKELRVNWNLSDLTLGQVSLRISIT